MKRVIAGFIVLAGFLVAASLGGNYMGFLLNSLTIDNTNHGWEVTRNSGHKQPDIPKNAREVLSKYKGIYAGSADKKSIYLTIDLGYESGNTPAILDVLKNNNIKASFFITKAYLEKCPELVDRIINEGHLLENHTANYRHLNILDDSNIRQEIMGLHEAVKSRYGVSMKYLRLPYEEWSERVMKIASETGYKTVFWSIACVDWIEDRDANYIYNSVMHNYHNGGVILIHAVSKESPRALDMIIKDLKSKGYELKMLDM